MSNLLNVSASPHIRNKTTSSDLMFDVILALMPASLYGVYQFGLNAFLIIITSIATSVLAEYAYEKLMKQPITTGDYSAFLTGLLLALNLPPTVPLWIPVIGSLFAIIIVKQLYGGLGQNFMNPALAARCFLLISFTGRMTTFTLDGVSGATPLGMLKETGEKVDLTNLFVGNIMGTIGETSVISFLIGAFYLLVKKVISIRIPLTYLGTFLVFLIIFGGHGFDISFLLYHLCGGGLILGAFFMATDYVTSPITLKGQIVYGVCLGVLTGIFRIFGGSAEGVSYAIIFCNLLVPLIEKVTVPVPYGRGRKTA